MADALAHRGPDDDGIWIDPTDGPGRCGLAHRRLAVIDPAGGRQPLLSDDGTLALTYNGECYNFRELRGELETLGHRFHTDCDTEVVLALYRQYGPAAVERMRGMFALAIWDGRKRQLFLARDRLGQKPLYYARHDGRLLFASEPKALLEADGFPRRAAPQSLVQYLLFGYVPAPATAFADVVQLPPAHTLTLTPADWQQARPQRYWSLPAPGSFGGTFAEGVEAVRAALTEAVRLRLVADVPLGAFLSGGVDSALVVALMARQQSRPVTTCSIGFGASRYNELPLARLTAGRWGCDHHDAQVAPDGAATIERLSHYYDEPFADSSALPTFHLARLARRHVTVALSGDGGDECFGGYDRYRALQWAQWAQQHAAMRALLALPWWRQLAGREYRGLAYRVARFCRAAARPPADRYLSWVAVFEPDFLTAVLQDGPLAAGLDPPGSITAGHPLARHLADCFAEPNAEPAAAAASAAAMRFDAEHYLPHDLNTKTDRATMAFGLELRSPFQDHRLVELAYSLPTAWRCRGRQSKVILRQAGSDLVAPEIVRRPKAGFGVPVGQWFRGELRALWHDTVLGPTALADGYLARPALERLWQEHQAGRHDHGHRLWALLMLELWRRRYLTAPAAPRT